MRVIDGCAIQIIRFLFSGIQPCSHFSIMLITQNATIYSTAIIIKMDAGTSPPCPKQHAALLEMECAQNTNNLKGLWTFWHPFRAFWHSMHHGIMSPFFSKQQQSHLPLLYAKLCALMATDWLSVRRSDLEMGVELNGRQYSWFRLDRAKPKLINAEIQIKGGGGGVSRISLGQSFA